MFFGEQCSTRSNNAYLTRWLLKSLLLALAAYGIIMLLPVVLFEPGLRGFILLSGLVLAFSAPVLSLFVWRSAEQFARQKEAQLQQTITELEAQCAAEQAARLEAEQAVRIRSEFVAHVSHEIRTPLNTIGGMTQLLQETSLTAEQVEYVDAVRAGSYTLGLLVDNILDFSKMEAGKMKLEEQSFDLHRCVEEIAALFRLQATAQALDFNISIAPDVPRLLVGDATRLRQVLINLLGNAIKFTHHGAVSLSVSHEKVVPDRIELTFVVTDTGIGIPPEQQGDLFQPFVQAESSTWQHYGGTGLGLAICKRLVTMMDGVISLQSEAGKGSTFRFSIPLKTVLTERSQTRKSVGSFVDGDLGRRHPLQILVAEDNVINQMLVARFLERFGYKPDIANNGLEVLQAIEHKSYDLIFMDVHMPKLDGLETARHVREAYLNARGPRIIVITGQPLQEDWARLLTAEIDDYLVKPLRIERLNRVLQETVAIEYTNNQH